ncbi:MAG: HIT family protein [Candidatus Izemoplasmatales bacterium]
MKCLFCDLQRVLEKIVYQNEYIYCIYDSFPVTKGHILIISKRHVENYFLLNKEELIAVNDALLACKKILDKEYKPTGYNIGVNNGKSAGQTIMHLHLHLIPRYDFDVDDPRGGVRGVIPEKQKY